MLDLLAAAVGLFGDLFDDDPVYEDDYYDEDLFNNPDVYRSLHPFGYNPVTGGWNSEEDKENGF